MTAAAPTAMGTRLTGPSFDIAAAEGDAAASQQLFERVERQLLQHGVVVLPDQRLTAAQLHAFALRFGPSVPPAWGGQPVEFPLSREWPGMLPLTNELDGEGEPLGAHKFGWVRAHAPTATPRPRPRASPPSPSPRPLPP